MSAFKRGPLHSPPMVLSYNYYTWTGATKDYDGVWKTTLSWKSRRSVLPACSISHKKNHFIRGTIPHEYCILEISGIYKSTSGTEFAVVCSGKRACWWLSCSSCRGFWFSSLSLQMKMWIGTRTHYGKEICKFWLLDLFFCCWRWKKFAHRLLIVDGSFLILTE